jgi:hypothetical protein
MYICYGISNGPYYRTPWDKWAEEDRYLWHAEPGFGIAVREKEDLALSVPEFDPTLSTPVKITLKRKSNDALLIEILQNSCLLYGQPELVWSEWRD